jgi:hypothetical protein
MVMMCIFGSNGMLEGVRRESESKKFQSVARLYELNEKQFEAF